MINIEQKLNPNIFEKDVKQIPIRDGYGEGLFIAGEEDSNIVAVCADLVESTRTQKFADKHPDRFIEIGVAEQNMASVASGLSAVGKVPFMTSYAMFSPGRNWEQIRTTICYNDRNVKIIGSHAGISVGPDGGTHQAIEDIAITRVIPRMTVIAPCDSIEAKKATIALAKTKDTTYLRLARNKTPVVTTEETPFQIGKANVLWRSENPKVGIVACGPSVYNALIAAKKLSDEGIGSIVVNLHTIKPIDTDTLVAVAKETGAIVTVEEHQIFGGMGSAVAECLSQNYPVPIEFVGVRDQFGQSGEPEELVKLYGMDADSIVRYSRKVLDRK